MKNANGSPDDCRSVATCFNAIAECCLVIRSNVVVYCIDNIYCCLAAAAVILKQSRIQNGPLLVVDPEAAQ